MNFATGVLAGIASLWIYQKIIAFLEAKFARFERELEAMRKEEGGIVLRSTKAGLGDEPIDGPPEPTGKPVHVNEKDRERSADRSFYRSRIRELERQLADVRKAMDR